MLLSSAGDVFLRHRLEQRFFRVLRQVFEDRGGVFARHDAKDDDLIFEAEGGQERGDVAGVAIAQHVAQPRVVARATASPPVPPPAAPPLESPRGRRRGRGR